MINNPCKNNGECNDLDGGGHTCTCKDGFTDANCGTGKFNKKVDNWST